MASSHIGLDLESIIFFSVLTLLGLVIDLFSHRKDSVISFKQALCWTLFWVIVGVSFGLFLFFHFSPEAASLYFAGYAFEMALSVDNLFAIMAIFAWFGLQSAYTHRVLYWGILGAMVFRLIFVVIGEALFSLGAYVEILFGLVVGMSAVVMLKKKEETERSDFSDHAAYKFVRALMPVFPKLVGNNFFISHKTVNEELIKSENKDINLKRHGLFYATPLFLCLAIVETSDVMFAFDSVPVVIAVSQDPFIVYSCMILAMLGLRSMYFVLDALRESIRFLEKGVIVLLFFVAAKLLLAASYELFGIGYVVDIYTSLIVIAAVLGGSIILSLVINEKT